jgi:hypothetical protein
MAPIHADRELIDRDPANTNHRLCLHGRHSEHERADWRGYRPSNLLGCFHPHFAGVTIAGHFVTGYRRPRALRLPATRVPDVFYPRRGQPLTGAAPNQRIERAFNPSQKSACAGR